MVMAEFPLSSMDDPLIRGIVEPFLPRMLKVEFGGSVDSESGIEFRGMSRDRLTYGYMSIYTYLNTLVLSFRRDHENKRKNWCYNLADPQSIDKIHGKLNELLPGDKDGG
jgi:hypothetical protein